MGISQSSNITDDSQVPSLTSARVTGITAIVLLTMVALAANMYLFIGRLIRSRRGDFLTGFDGLVLNLLFANFCLALLVYPYDVVTYVVLNGHWPFSTPFCYTSAVFTSLFPFISCWSVSAMTLHQFCSYVSFISNKLLPTAPRKCPRLLSLLGPVTVIWLITLCIYCPVSHTHWDIVTSLYKCSMDGGLLHESAWYFWIPFATTCLTAAAIGAIYILTRIPLPPAQEDGTATINEPAVRWSDIDTIHKNNQPDRDVYSSLNPLYMDYPTESDVNVADSLTPPKDPATNASSAQPENIKTTANQYIQPAELRREHLKISLLFAWTLLIFMAPYAVTVLLYHVSIETEIDFAMPQNLWHGAFTWMTTKPLWEPFLLLAVAPTYRRAAFHCLSPSLLPMQFRS